MESPRSRFILILTILTIIFPAPSSHSVANVLEGIVVKIADADTITVLDSDKAQHRVRIAGIDAPEKGSHSARHLGIGLAG